MTGRRTHLYGWADDQFFVKLHHTGLNLRLAELQSNLSLYYCTAVTAGGFHVPSPGGKIDGGVSFGQYRRITM
jgi:hypothetical protein